MPSLNPAYADVLELLTIVPDGDEAAVAAVRARDSQLTKPAGSLGALEGLVEFLARWQGRAQPRLDNPMVTIFAGNHGVTDQGVSSFPREVTEQMVANFTGGGAAISSQPSARASFGAPSAIHRASSSSSTCGTAVFIPAGML